MCFVHYKLPLAIVFVDTQLPIHLMLLPMYRWILIVMGSPQVRYYLSQPSSDTHGSGIVVLWLRQIYQMQQWHLGSWFYSCTVGAFSYYFYI